MRILVNGLSARLGGGQTYLLQLLKHVPQGKDWKVFLLCPDNLNLAGLPANIERIGKNLALANPFERALWEYTRLGALAEKLSADLLFSPGGLLPPFLPAGLKTAVTFQNMLPFDHEQRKRYRPGYRRLRDWLLERALSSAMRRADLVIFISQFARQFIETRLGTLRGSNVIIPHGIDPQFFPQIPPPPPPSFVPSGDYFLYVSYIDYYKSQIEVVCAFAELCKRTGTKTPLLLAGAENPAYGQLLRQKIAALGLKDAVILLGNIAHHELPALYQHARINLFASCTENCPNILLEIMASGRPALVSSRDPMPEFAGDRVTYFDPDNVDGLASAWESCLSNPQHAETLAAHAAARVASMTWGKSARAAWQAIEEMVKEPS